MVNPIPRVIVYTSSTGGSRVREATTRVMALLTKVVSREYIHMEFMDIELSERKRALRQAIWEQTGKKGTWPLVYVNTTFIGDVAELERLNEQNHLQLALNCAKATSV